MITHQAELLCECVPEVGDLLEMHYQELCVNKERVKLDPMWGEYAKLEQAGMFVVCTTRDDGKLIGYAAFFLTKHMHYEGLTVASNDVLFLHPGHRQGMTGVRLIKFSEAHMQSLGAHKITWHAKHNTPLAPILERMGYASEETMLGKLF